MGRCFIKKGAFIKNAAILTATSLLLRFAGIIFKVWLSGKIGSEGIGLYQVIFSFYVLASTFATSGIATAVTRLCAEEIAKEKPQNCKKILRASLLLTLIIAVISAVIIIFSADFIGSNILGDERTVISLKILPLALPFIGASSVFRGYFIAKRRILPNSLGQIFEQAVRIGIIATFINLFYSKGIAACCFGIILGDALAEIFGFLLLLLSYFVEIREIKGQKTEKIKGLLGKIIHISLPITSGRYLNSLLRTGENILVPKNLAKFKLSSQNALSQFGMIKGMALPILFFPSAILNSVSTLLIPEISEAVTRQNRHAIKAAAEKIIKLTLLCGLICGSIFFVGGEKIGILIYKNGDVGYLIKALSPIVPLMYLDSICDGILKGLDQQSFTFKTAVSDSTIRLILILIILPKMGIKGFILIMYFSNLYTCILNVGRLIKISKAKISFFNDLFVPLTSAFSGCFITSTVLSLLNLQNNLVYIILLAGVSTAFYIGILLYLEIIPRKAVKMLKNNTRF